MGNRRCITSYKNIELLSTFSISLASFSSSDFVFCLHLNLIFVFSTSRIWRRGGLLLLFKSVLHFRSSLIFIAQTIVQMAALNIQTMTINIASFLNSYLSNIYFNYRCFECSNQPFRCYDWCFMYWKIIKSWQCYLIIKYYPCNQELSP